MPCGPWPLETLTIARATLAIGAVSGFVLTIMLLIYGYPGMAILAVTTLVSALNGLLVLGGLCRAFRALYEEEKKEEGKT